MHVGGAQNEQRGKRQGKLLCVQLIGGRTWAEANYGSIAVWWAVQASAMRPAEAKRRAGWCL
jgi:hypothetical protein